MNEIVRVGDWMQTFTGRQFWPMDPRPEEILVEDIAHSLSMMCRYAGHCLQFYSVAEHCCLLHDYVADEHKAWALFHDASEAYLVDVPRPLKPFLPGYKDAEKAVMAAVAERFGLGEEPPEIRDVDGRILGDEAAQNMSDPPMPWAYFGPHLGVKLRFWSPYRAKTEFLLRAYKVMGEDILGENPFD